METAPSLAKRGDTPYCWNHAREARVTRGLLRSRVGYLYLARNKTRGWGKWGWTTNPHNRIGKLGAREWQFVSVWEFPTGYDAEAVEREIQRMVTTRGAGHTLDHRGDTETFHWASEDIGNQIQHAAREHALLTQPRAA